MQEINSPNLITREGQRLSLSRKTHLEFKCFVNIARTLSIKKGITYLKGHMSYKNHVS